MIRGYNTLSLYNYAACNIRVDKKAFCFFFFGEWDVELTR